MKRSITKIVAVILASVLIMGELNYVPVEAASKKGIGITVKNSITGSTKKVIVAKGKTVKLLVKANKAANKKVSYKSSNTKIAMVNGKGEIKGKKVGKATITVKSKKNPKVKKTIKVIVKASAVKSVKISKSSSNMLYTGNSIKLKAVVKGQKSAYKTLCWSSNNSKIASVTQNGVVKALSEGSVRITAKAADGSGKKSSVVITVKNEPINIESVSVLNRQTVSFKLSKAKTLVTSDVKIYSKYYYSGEYRNQLTIDDLKSSDSINYTVTLSNNTMIFAREYIKVLISSLTGINSKEVQFNEDKTAYSDETIVELTVGKALNSYSYDDDEYYYFNPYGLYFNQAEGYYSQEIKGLPEGIKSKIEDNNLVLYGTPTKAGMTTATYTAIDEVGNTMTRSIIFIVGSPDDIEAAATTVYGLASNRGKYAYIQVVGGSGNYDYSFAGGTNTYGCSIDYDEVYGVFEKAGTYSIKVVVKDINNDSLTKTVDVKFVIKQGVTLAGTVTDMSGNPIMDDIYMSFDNKDKSDRYTSSEDCRVDESGKYSVYLNPGTYDITVSYCAGTADSTSVTKHLYSQKISASISGNDIKLHLYKVEFLLSQELSDEFYGAWKDLNGETYGYGKVIYVKPGTYTLTSDYDSTENWYDIGLNYELNSTFTVTDSPIYAKTSYNESSMISIKGNILLDKNVVGSTDSSYDIYKFIATESGTVYYTDNRSEQYNDIYVSVYDNTSKEMIDSNMDDSGNFYATAGHEYLIRVKEYDDAYSFSYCFEFSRYSSEVF